MSRSLISNPNLVESPYITATLGPHKLGTYAQTEVVNRLGIATRTQFPNYIHSLNVTKVNGVVNTYNFQMIYQIRAGNDPNYVDKLLSSVSDTRKIVFSYGDSSSPSFIFKEEEAIINKVVSNVDFANSCITYNITATSSSNLLAGTKFNFSKVTDKPSNVILRTLYNKKYGLCDTFTGMRDKNAVLKNNLIAMDDQVVEIEARNNISPLDYLTYLVNCMISIESATYKEFKTRYMISVNDDTKGLMSGAYFKVTKISNKIKMVDSLDTFEVDVGYPGNNFVTQFQVQDDQSWAILYNYSDRIDQPNYTYRIDNSGNIISEYAPTVTYSSQLMKETTASKVWWNNVTQFPIKATLKIKGLIRPAILMSNLRVNALFYGQKHSSSGLYVITKQVDTINASGYSTTLDLLRIGADNSDLGVVRSGTAGDQGRAKEVVK